MSKHIHISVPLQTPETIALSLAIAWDCNHLIVPDELQQYAVGGCPWNTPSHLAVEEITGLLD